MSAPIKGGFPKGRKPVTAWRNSRFHYARLRIEKILQGQPPLSEEQRAQLAFLLYPEGQGK